MKLIMKLNAAMPPPKMPRPKPEDVTAVTNGSRATAANRKGFHRLPKPVEWIPEV